MPRPGYPSDQRAEAASRRSFLRSARAAAHAARAGATPLAKNAYKVPLFETLVRRAILAAAA